MLKLKNNKKSIYLFIIIFAIFFSIFFILHQNLIYTSYSYKMPEDTYSISERNILEVYNYTKDNNSYILNGDSPYLMMTAEEIIGSIEIDLDITDREDLTTIKVYYSENENFNEAKTVSKSVENDVSTVLVNIPAENIKNIRIAIDNEFNLNKLLVSSDHMIFEKIQTTTSNYIIFILVDIIISFGIALAIVKMNLFARIKRKIITINKKRFFIRLTLYVVSIVGILGVQVLFTNQFVIKTNTGYLINIMRLAFSIMLVTLFWGFIWLRNNFKENIEKIFLLISLSVGITYAISTPMLQESTWDAGIHYSNTIELVYFDQDALPSIDKRVGWLEYSYNLNDLNSIQEKYNEDYFFTSGITETRDWSLVGIYNNLGYIPSAFGIFIARGLTLSFSTSIMVGKIFNSITYSIIIYGAIKRLKTGKLVLFILSLYPTAILLAGTYSYDYWVNAFVYLGLAYLFANIQEKEKYISWKEMIIIASSLFIGIGPKAIYFPIMLLCYFMPKCKFKTDKDRFLYYGIITFLMLLAVVSFLVPFIFGVSAGTEVGDTRGGADVNSSQQVRYILAHPLIYAKTLLAFIADYWSFSNIANYSTNLAYIGMGGYSSVLVASMIGTLVVGDDSAREKNISIIFKIFTIILVFGLSCIVASAFYVAYTDVGADYIGGCQPRYILPILFPIAYCLRNTYKPIKISKKEIFNFIIIILCSFVLVYILFNNIIMIYSIY